MGIKDSLAGGFDSLMRDAGRAISIEYYTSTIGSVWDDETTLAKSGNTLSISGIIMSLGPTESLLVEQGKLLNDDKKLYVSSGIGFTGSDFQVKVTVGGEKYTTIPEVNAPEVEGIIVYKKGFIRRLTTGSLLGE